VWIRIYSDQECDQSIFQRISFCPPPYFQLAVFGNGRYMLGISELPTGQCPFTRFLCRFPCQFFFRLLCIFIYPFPSPCRLQCPSIMLLFTLEDPCKKGTLGTLKVTRHGATSGIRWPDNCLTSFKWGSACAS